MTRHNFSAFSPARRRVQRRDALALVFFLIIYLSVLLELVFLSAKPSFWLTVLLSVIVVALLVAMLLIGFRDPDVDPTPSGTDSSN